MNSQLWIVNSDANQHKDLIQESLVAENSYSLMFLMVEIQANWNQSEPNTALPLSTKVQSHEPWYKLFL